MIDSVKSSAYLRHKRSITGITYAMIQDVSGVPGATMSSYFNGTVKTPKPETFEALVRAVGGTMAEYELWSQQAEPSENGGYSMTIQEITDTMQRAFNVCTLHMETAFNTTLATIKSAHDAEIRHMQNESRRDRHEKYALFVILLIVAAYAIFAFTHYDLKDPTSGLTSLMQ